MTPTNSPVGEASRPADVDSIPQPSLATLDLGTDGPGFDGTGSFVSYDSDLSPEATIGTYAAQLIQAGFHDVGSQGAWRVFVGPNLTVWFRVGSDGPPTSLLVRIEASSAADSDIGDPRTSSSGSSSGGVGGPAAVDGSKATSRTTSQRRPDPPHGGTGTATTTGGSRGGTTGSGTATGGTSGTGSTSGGGSVTGGGTTGGGTTGGSSGTGTGGGGDGLRP